MDSRDPAATTNGTQQGRRSARKPRGALFFLLLFLALGLALDALVGDRGVFALMRARREYNELDLALSNIRAENTRRREQIQRFSEDPAAIEELARQHLGLIKPGETVFIVKDVRPAKPLPR